MSENILINNILDSDSYKFGQYAQYPKGMSYMYSYFESRGGQFDKTVFFGLQYLLKKYLTQRVILKDVLEASEFAKKHGVWFNTEGWAYIAKDLKGKLPVKIMAVKEGAVVDKHNVLITIESTDKKVPWIVNWLETMLVRTWYPISVATLSHECKKLIMKYENLSVDNDKIEQDILFKLNDFGSRGSSSRESASIGGASHLVSFDGSDNVVGTYMANKYYNCEMSSRSIIATEHSTVTSWGKENESTMMKNLLETFKDEPLVACVSDSYDFENCVDNIWGKDLKELVLSSNGYRICRPDGGDPNTCVLYALNSFAKSYGYTINSKNYKVLNKMRIIQGDGMNYDSIKKLMQAVIDAGFSVENVNVGMGAGLLQTYVHRDTHEFAFKCSYIELEDGTTRDVFKQPKNCPNKNSKRGKLMLVKNTNGVYETKPLDVTVKNELQRVFRDGEVLKTYSFDEVRANAKEDVG